MLTSDLLPNSLLIPGGKIVLGGRRNNRAAFQEYRTPPELFHELDEEFHFTLDAAASKENALCPRFFTKEQDGLEQPWLGRTVFVNPPYARWSLFRWVEKAVAEAKAGATVVMLVPTSVETEWFHTYCWDARTQGPRRGVEVRFLKGRPRFIDPRNKEKSYKGWRPLTAVMVVVFRPWTEGDGLEAMRGPDSGFRVEQDPTVPQATREFVADLIGICDCGAPTDPTCVHCADTVKRWAAKVETFVKARLDTAWRTHTWTLFPR